jgi:tetratricopeptide (TPR) repeat protein
MNKGSRGKKTLLVMAMIALFGAKPGLRASDSPAGTGVLFVTSSPLGATVLLDGIALPDKTPLVLRNAAVGSRSLLLYKEGYERARAQIEVTEDRVQTVVVELVPVPVTVLFPEEKAVHIGSKKEDSHGNAFSIVQGTYAISRWQNILSIEPVFPQQGAIDALTLAIPLSLFFSGISAVQDLVSGSSGPFLFSPLTLSACAAGVAAIGLDAALHVKKAQFIASFTPTVRPQKESLLAAEESFARGEETLALGRLDEALRFYLDVVEKRTDSPLHPQALYKMAKIHSLTGQHSLAEAELRLIVARYPVPELLDKACRTLADILFARGSFEKSIQALAQMVNVDPLFPREDVLSYKCQILEKWTQRDPTKGSELLGACRELLASYGDSAKRPYHLYRYASALALSGQREEAIAQLSLIDGTIDADLAAQVARLSETIRGEK